MYQLERAGMTLFEVDAGDAAVIDLTEELAEIGAALVPYPSIGDELGIITGFHYTVGEIDVLAEAHLRKTAQLLIDIAADAHVEGAGIKLIELLLSTANAAGGKKGSHGVGNGFLDGCE